MIYELKDVSFTYPLGDNHIDALKKINLKINEGDFITLAGPSGSGKSTLLNLLGLIEPLPQNSGEIFFKGASLNNLSEDKKNELRKFELGFIFQNFHLNPILTVAENVEFFLSRQNIEKKERKRRVEEALNLMGLLTHQTQKPNELSGGQRQRVAIARAYAKNPKVIIADEPTASLDQKTGSDIINLLKEINKTKKTTIIIASHDPMVLKNAKRLLYLRDGQIQEETLL